MFNINFGGVIGYLLGKNIMDLGRETPRPWDGWDSLFSLILGTSGSNTNPTTIVTQRNDDDCDRRIGDLKNEMAEIEERLSHWSVFNVSKTGKRHGDMCRLKVPYVNVEYESTYEVGTLVMIIKIHDSGNPINVMGRPSGCPQDYSNPAEYGKYEALLENVRDEDLEVIQKAPPGTAEEFEKRCNRPMSEEEQEEHIAKYTRFQEEREREKRRR
jgi:hypothetical protein